MAAPWDPEVPGLLRLPSGRAIRARGLLRESDGILGPDFGVCLLAEPPQPHGWDQRWVEWPDFGLPADEDSLQRALSEALRRSAAERVEVACAGGLGRTGTALACLAVLDELEPAEAISYVRAGYHLLEVETPAQEAFVLRRTPSTTPLEPSPYAEIAYRRRPDRATKPTGW